MSYVSSPGVIEHLGATTSLTLGEISGKVSDRVERIATVMRDASITVLVPEDITVALWKKFAFICVVRWRWRGNTRFRRRHSKR